jgi:hypothetical protein
MRLSYERLVRAAVAAFAGIFLAACQSSNLPISPNGPNGNYWSTNSALLRIVNGSPNAGTPCTVGGQNTTCVDVVVDGSVVASGVPYPTIQALDSFAILPYVSVPSGSALIQIYQAGTKNFVYEMGVPVSANKKYSFILAGQAPIAPPAPFFAGFLFNDGLFNAPFGAGMVTFHNASPNAGSTAFLLACAACGTGITVGTASPPTVPGVAVPAVGPVNLVPSAGYLLTGTAAATRTLAPSALDPADTSNTLPDPTGKQNVSVYEVDTAGGGMPPNGNFQLIGVFDTNG